MARVPSGPGPNAYVLPTTVGYENHDNRKPRMPQYSFGARTKSRNGDTGPGPGAYQVNQWTRYGKGGGLQYTMAPLTNARNRGFGPGPGAHDVHSKPMFKGSEAPAYTMSGRNNYNFKNFGPGPSAYTYNTDPIMHAAPAYSMGKQTNNVGNSKSPGPAAYNAGDLNNRLNRAPAYSMRPKCDLKVEPVGPGSNYYDLMYYRPGRNRGAYSFGVRHAPYAPPMVVRCDNM
ncbi:outer dense fiber protein 3-like protein 2 [Drosophila hydei]|uniref:Outer dense fiber protein 3-like protein 2 n=1 Tax=Drosophila hydei TaxID=7224 RepID=A0A6J1MA88_DROHY|nr:outer dense fiber protein 3-like protein 2 [Drosophila hydei]